MKKIFVSVLLVILGLTCIACNNGNNNKLINPNQEFIIECLEKVESITEIVAVTEENDPNGNLNKQGGYTACVYFSVAMIDQDEIYGDSVIDKGTDCGGCIEVYKTIDDAIKRNDYLSSFDGTIFVSGSHTVIGSIVVRTSNYLTATQQKQLEESILNVLK